MAKKSKSFWNNGWTIAIGSAILVSVVSDIFNVTDIWAWVLGAIVFIWNFLLQRIETPLWILIILPFAGISVLLLILWIESLSNPDREKPAFFDYTEDVFDGRLYRWRYRFPYGNTYEIVDITRYCATCKCRLINGRCPKCNTTRQGFERPTEEIEALILLKIEEQQINQRKKK